MDEIIANNKKHIPNIENFFLQKYVVDMRKYTNYMTKSTFAAKYKAVAQSVVDIRNNSDPVSEDSNTVDKTDNKFSNETKKMIKILLSKGWSAEEIALEMERIYGSGSIVTTRHLRVPLGKTIFVNGIEFLLLGSILTTAAYGLSKVFRKIKI